MRQPVEVTLFAGTFDSQPLVFAHLYDLGALNLDEVEVICKTDPAPRLAHYFAPDQINTILDAMGLHTTLVLAFPEAGRLAASEKLFPLGIFSGTRVRA